MQVKWKYIEEKTTTTKNKKNKQEAMNVNV